MSTSKTSMQHSTRPNAGRSTDTAGGGIESYAIELHVAEETWLQLTLDEADYLAQQLRLLAEEARRVPVTRSTGVQSEDEGRSRS
ncbi:hypothetical protein [Nocardia sp. CC227C]|uniref:hypothetical protein n=1 Tax=Nocardia sp. CC227C TaxID=3044562 RepID=UPI00278C0326|nr:hypothetical protein [Nocardia sp. CC227C]